MKSLSLLALPLLLGASGCDEATPVAPSGTLLSISATPSEIPVRGSSTIRVTALRANGTPVNPGTLIRLDTTLGTIDESAATDETGVAQATLRGDGRIGTATVTARSGASEAATVEVEVGEAAANASLQATPSSIPETGGTITLLALVRNDQGQPLPNATVNFKTEVGTLASGGAFLTTDATGQVSDTLTVTEADIAALGDDDFQVGLEVGGAGAVVSQTFDIRIQRPPDAAFSFVRNQLTVAFEDQSTNNPTSWTWEFGDGQTSRQQNPTHTYSAPDTYTVTLTVRNAIGEDSVSQLVQVTQ